MPTETLPLLDTLIGYLVGGADGFKFERLIQELLSIREERRFTALGGNKDGGADGFLRSVWEDEKQVGHYVQISKQENVTSKIRGTVARLNEVGRVIPPFLASARSGVKQRALISAWA
ncbi:MAG: hypothetical protein K2Y31_05870 [Burkholderiales bacterium]|jgi:hypothetical protein|nr:hypothetical protein [Burkholderiales bacterium]